MSGFGGFGSGLTGGGVFGDKPSEQASSGFNIPTTAAVTTTTGITFGTTSFGTGGTGGLFGVPQQTTFGTNINTKPVSAGPGFVFNTSANTTAPTFGSSGANVSLPTFGIPQSTAAPVTTSFNIPITSSAFTSFVSTTAPTFGSTSVSFNVPKTTGVTGFTLPVTSTTASSTFNFGLTTTTATTSAPLTFGMQAAAPSAAVTTTGSTTSTLTFCVSTSGATSTSAPSTGFTLSQPTTTSSLTFGAPKTTKTLTFGTAGSDFGTSTTTATTYHLGNATPNVSVGSGLFSTTKTSETVTQATTTSTGLGGVDNKQTTQGLSGVGTLEPKHAKDYTLPEPILQTLNEFQNFTKQQKSLSVEISHGSSKPLKKVQEDTEAMESLLTMISSGLIRNAIAVDKLKTETAQGLHQAEMAQRNHETPPGLDYDNTAPADYFNDLVTKFETDTVRLKVQMEASEKHLRSLTQSSTISPQELTLAMRRLHETLIVLAARVQALHTSVLSQKEQFKNLRRVYFKDDTNIFENDSDQNLVKKQTIYSLRSLTGPTPFSENPSAGLSLNVDGLAMLASSTGASIPTTSTSASWISSLQEAATTSSLLPVSNFLGCFQPVESSGFQLSKLPTGYKRSRH